MMALCFLRLQRLLLYRGGRRMVETLKRKEKIFCVAGGVNQTRGGKWRSSTDVKSCTSSTSHETEKAREPVASFALSSRFCSPSLQ